MMKKITSLANSLILTLFLASCSPLQSPFIIGKRAVFPENKIGTETVWKLDGEIYYIKITSSNSLSGAIVEWDSNAKTYQTTTGELVLSELDGKQFLNVKDDCVYNIHRIVPAGNNSIVFYPIDGAEMKKHIPSGRVESKKDNGIYLLKGTKEEIDTFVLEHINTIFDPDSAIVAELIEGEL